MRWQVPEPLSICEISLDLENRSFVRQHGNPSGPRLVLCHGNGLAIDLYYPFWSLLEPDFELFVYDLRSHGWNEVSKEEDHNLFSLVSDLDTILHEIEQHYGIKPVVGVYHSLSAMISLLLSSPVMATSIDRRSREFSGLVLFDPPMHRPGKSHSEFDEAVEGTARIARRRTESFDSLEQYQELLDFFPAYSRLVPGAKELMGQTILRESRGGDYRLRCPRDYEARIIEYVRAFAGQADLDKLPCPTKIVGADPLLPTSYLPTVDFSDMLSVDFDFIPETTHFMQIEKPSECAEYVHEFMAALHKS
ncbi:MAG: alpha/beta hydrolase [Gammaproteobacteria bacterium]|nr:alpha/beta hydrolase [Gammaproteobacteria bacterium]MYD79570.1 alpha/beta hydrolase [Gammaproteobacteria bacterium]